MAKIVFFTKSVSIQGGKEKVLVSLANYLVTQGYHVSIITYDGSIESFFNINPAVTIHTLPVTFIHYSDTPLRQLWHFIKDVRRYKSLSSIITNADYCIATDQIITSIFYYAFKQQVRKLLVWEHLSYINYNSSRVWQYFVKKIYPKAKLLIALNEEESKYYSMLGCRVQTIPNTITKSNKINLSVEGNVVWVGAVTREKGIEALPALAEMFKQYGLYNTIHIYGKGDSEEYLKETIKIKALSDILIYKGVTGDTAEIYKGATALLVTSKHECLPTVILEAFSYGLPVIAFDCPTGPRNMIKDNVDGRLIPMDDIKSLYKGLYELVSNPQLLQSMGDAAYGAADNYAPEVIYKKWKNILV